MRFVLFTLFVLASLSACTQNPSRDSFDPKVSELWDPKPPKVNPGTNPGDAPSDAIILFDGKNVSEWISSKGGVPEWEVKDGALTVVKGKGNIRTKKTFGDVQLHIEWRSPAVIEGEGQDRGNSGIFFQDRYELQVLDSYESQTYSNGQAGSIYKQHIPLANATRKAGEWQVYDVIYIAPHFSENGRVITPAKITVIHNGVLIQNGVEIWGGTEYKGVPVYKAHGKGPIQLQDHSNPVSYRNIWIREL